jgi:hypothetical protein
MGVEGLAPIVLGSLAFLMLIIGVNKNNIISFSSLLFASVSISLIGSGHIKQGIIICVIGESLAFLLNLYRGFKDV